MIRKILYVTGAVTLLTLFFVGKDAISYVSTAAGSVTPQTVIATMLENPR